MNYSTLTLHGKTVAKDGTEAAFWSLEVPAKDAPMPHHIAGLSFTATGYGKDIPTRHMVRFNGRWRRVYMRIYSNIGTAYLKTAPGEVILVRD